MSPSNDVRWSWISPATAGGLQARGGDPIRSAPAGHGTRSQTRPPARREGRRLRVVGVGRCGHACADSRAPRDGRTAPPPAASRRMAASRCPEGHARRSIGCGDRAGAETHRHRPRTARRCAYPRSTSRARRARPRTAPSGRRARSERRSGGSGHRSRRHVQSGSVRRSDRLPRLGSRSGLGRPARRRHRASQAPRR